MANQVTLKATEVTAAVPGIILYQKGIAEYQDSYIADIVPPHQALLKLFVTSKILSHLGSAGTIF